MSGPEFGSKMADATSRLLTIVFYFPRVALWIVSCFRNSTLKLLVKMINYHEIVLWIFCLCNLFLLHHYTLPYSTDFDCLKTCVCHARRKHSSWPTLLREKAKDSDFLSFFFLRKNQTLFVVANLEMISTKDMYMVIISDFKGITGILPELWAVECTTTDVLSHAMCWA